MKSLPEVIAAVQLLQKAETNAGKSLLSSNKKFPIFKRKFLN